ncbi:MAG: TVP38/TMEM64 family protein [Legionellales bacterium]|nr:TVP38/TMEM64 family protein [Legionellales bacterium]
MMRWLTRFLTLGTLLLLLILFFYFHLYRYLSFESLNHYHHQLVIWTDEHYVLTVLGFMLAYIAVVAISVPGATFLTLTGGFLFGILLGTLYVVIAATIGATILFLAVKTSFGEWLAKRAVGKMAAFEEGFRKNEFNYILTLRLIPIVPFWLINIVSALFNVRARNFILATALGIIPGSLVYVLLGNGLGYLFDSGKTPDLGIIFAPKILVPLLALAALSLLPVVYRAIKGKAGGKNIKS